MELLQDYYSEATIKAIADQGIEIELEDETMELAVPLNTAFANPHLVTQLGFGPIAAGMGGEPQYSNDVAARLKAIYGSVDREDAFVGMVSEPHIIGSEFGELQYAIWETQFLALRDGDANFYLWNRSLKRNLRELEKRGLTYKQTLADIIVQNTALNRQDMQENMFIAE